MPTGRAEIMEQLLRTQMQARYGPERLGHFGLALATYAHFTSPIRRYADLLVHRALVSAYRLGDGGLPPGEDERFERDRRADLDARAARDGGRARHDRPLCRRLPRRPGRPARRVPHHRRPAVRLLRHGRGPRRRRARPRPDARPGIFPLRRSGAAAGRRRDRRDLSRRPAADAAARRGQSGVAARCASSFPRAATAARVLRASGRTGFEQRPPRPAANIRHDNRRR